jgi:3D (Asp-Asp-Asp) domain-containing protein
VSALAVAVVTAYVATCSGCSGRTASGLPADHRLDLVAASRERALGSCVAVEVEPGSWRTLLVADRGGALRPGSLDLLVATREQAIEWGRRKVAVRTVACPERLRRTWAARPDR